MNTTTIQPDPFVILYGIPWETYEKILDALGRYQLRHTYIKGTLEMRGLLYGVAWEDYTAFLDALGDYPLRHTYYRGALEMMAPRKDHDWPKSFLGRIIELLTFALGIDVQCIGSTTLTGRAVECGFQPDEAYYVANEPRVRGRTEYDPEVDPPPDLIVEVDVTSSSVPRMPGFAALGIPEVWRHDGGRVRFFHLTESGQYDETERSTAFPFLSCSDINACLEQLGKAPENTVLRALVDKVTQQRQGSPRDNQVEGNQQP